MPKTISKVELETLMKIRQDPVLWAKTHIVTYDGAQKKYVPWTARWYQAEMLRDQSRRKVYRCGRRTGNPIRVCRFSANCGKDSLLSLTVRLNEEYNPQPSLIVSDGFRDCVSALLRY